MCGAEIWTLRKVDKKLPGAKFFEIWCCRRMEKINLTYPVKSEDIQGDSVARGPKLLSTCKYSTSLLIN